MITNRSIGADDARRLLAAAIALAQQDGVAMSFAVVDASGELLASARMDGSPAWVMRHAVRQAFTSGVMYRDTVTFKKQLGERDGNLDEWGDDRLTTLPGGVAIRFDGEAVGAIGAGGSASYERDTEIARQAVIAAGFVVDVAAQK